MKITRTKATTNAAGYLVSIPVEPYEVDADTLSAAADIAIRYGLTQSRSVSREMAGGALAPLLPEDAFRFIELTARV